MLIIKDSERYCITRLKYKCLLDHMIKGSCGHHLSSELGLEMHHFSKADLMLSTLIIGMVVTGTSDVRKEQ